MSLLSWLIPGIDIASKTAQHAANTAIDWEYQKKQNEWNADEAEKARQFNADEALKNREFQTQEREAAQQWDLDMWNRTNEYNSPVEQMSRLLQAGINPNTAIGQIQGGNAQAMQTNAQSGNAASGPSASGSFSAGAPGDVGWGSSYLTNEQARLGLQKTQEDVRYAQLQNDYQETVNSYIGKNVAIDYNIKQVTYDKINQEVRNLEQIWKKTGTEIDLNAQEYMKRLIRNPQEIRDADMAFNLMMAQKASIIEQTNNLKKTGVLIEEQTKTEQVNQAVGQSQIALNNAQEGEIQANKENIEEQTRILKNENEAKIWWLNRFGYMPQDDTVKFMMKCLSMEDRDKANNMWKAYLKATQSYLDYSTYLDNPANAIDYISSRIDDEVEGYKDYKGAGNGFNFPFDTIKPPKYNPDFSKYKGKNASFNQSDTTNYFKWPKVNYGIGK